MKEYCFTCGHDCDDPNDQWWDGGEHYCQMCYATATKDRLHCEDVNESKKN